MKIHFVYNIPEADASMTTRAPTQDLKWIKKPTPLDLSNKRVSQYKGLRLPIPKSVKEWATQPGRSNVKVNKKGKPEVTKLEKVRTAMVKERKKAAPSRPPLGDITEDNTMRQPAFIRTTSLPVSRQNRRF